MRKRIQFETREVKLSDSKFTEGVFISHRKVQWFAAQFKCTRGDRVRVEMNRVEIVARVVACDYGQGTLRIVRYAHVISSRERSSMRRVARAH